MVAEVGLNFAETSSGQFDGPGLEQFPVMKHALDGSSVGIPLTSDGGFTKCASRLVVCFGCVLFLFVTIDRVSV